MNCWSAGQVGYSDLAANGAQVLAETASRAAARRPALVNVSEEQRNGHPRMRLLRGRDGQVPAPVRVHRHRARHTPTGARERDSYHAGKWGIEGFIDAVNQEVACFNITATLVEPGGARTEFRYGSSKLGPRLDAYTGTPASMVRRMIEEASAVPIGDPAKMASLMIATVDQTPAPKRLALGSDSYTTMHKALSARLAELEAQKELAFTTDFPTDV
jgi:NAD(P)-dependent dehydrogenase (short-subunit alcohol dehydrogenase family)